ncbi:MAG TPA: lipopolysaccharide biosynthesis protein [Gemmatimonadales bacterium]|nr:lipopolysaccharide biosynthesis protein [Gemmatimonadales bacterium]
MTGIAKHAAIYAAGTILAKAVSFVLLPLYTRLLTPADYGILQLLAMATELVSIVAGSRIAWGIFHFYHKAETLPEKHSVLSTAMVLLIVTYSVAAVAAALGAPAIAKMMLGEREVYTTYVRLAVFSLALEGLVVVPLAHMQIRDKSGLYVAVGLTKLLLQLAFNLVLLIPFRLGVLGVLLSSLLANVLLGCWLATWLIRDVGVRVQRPVMRGLLRVGLPLVGMQIATVVLAYGDRYFLNRAASPAEVGLYGLAYQFGFLLYQLGYQPFQQVWDPRRFQLASHPDREIHFARAFVYANLLVLGFAVALALFSRDLIRVMADEAFHTAADIIPLVLAAYVFQAWAGFHNVGVFIRERTELWTVATWVSALVALTGYLVLIPRLLAFGAALTAVASMSTRFGLLYYFSQELWPVRYRWRPVLLLAAAAVAVVAASVPTRALSLPVGFLSHVAMFGVFVAVAWRWGGLDADERRRVVKELLNSRATLGRLVPALASRK